MLETKIFELRDAGTFIPIIAIRMVDTHVSPLNHSGNYLLRRAGFGNGDGFPAVLLTRASGGGPAESDPYSWGDRTLQVAHIWLEKNFSTAENGSVIDVEFILGESAAPKVSEQYG